MRLTLRLGSTFNDLLDDIQNGDFRIGLHVQSIDGGDSDAFVSGPGTPGVPLPSAAGLGGAALVGLAVRRRRTV
jgi:MYXO-CTERM domain-containing protein